MNLIAHIFTLHTYYVIQWNKGSKIIYVELKKEK